MARAQWIQGRSAMVVVLGLAGLAGCDKLPGFGTDESVQANGETPPAADPTAAAEPDQKSATPSNPELPSDAADKQPATPAAPTPAIDEPEPEPAPVAVVSEFDGLLVRVSGLPDPRQSTESTVDAVNKTAWTHYKAKQWPDAAQFFARVAARDPGWKHAHNLACASAMAGKPDDARIALVESLKRGGEAAKASAKKDSDLATVRGLPWFATLLANPSADEEADEELDDEQIAPPNCPAGTKWDDEHYCWYDTLAEWKFEEVVFPTPVTLTLEVPERPKDARWKRARGKIPWADLRAELGIQHTIESEPISVASQLVEMSMMVWEQFIDDPEDDTMAYFWWPDDNGPILVLPNKQKLSRNRFMGVILARKTDAGWRAINLTVTKDAQLGPGSTNNTFESGVVLRFDGLELFTLTQYVWHGEDKPQVDDRMRFMCRIRIEQGKLQRACTETWKETGKSFG